MQEVNIILRPLTQASHISISNISKATRPDVNKLHSPSMFAVKAKFMECSIISPALPPLMKHLVIGQGQKTHNFLAFHWSQHGSLVSIGQHFLIM